VIFKVSEKWLLEFFWNLQLQRPPFLQVSMLRIVHECSMQQQGVARAVEVVAATARRLPRTPTTT
jgi:hypothetical protein